MPPTALTLRRRPIPNRSATTATNTATATDTPTNTPTPIPTATNTEIPTSTPTEMPTEIPTVSVFPTSEILCIAPPNWTTYTVQPGDSLIAIANAVGSSVEDLIVANCLKPDQNIAPGMSINVPNAPVALVATGVPVFPTGTPEPLPECTIPGLRIIAPVAGDALTGTFNLVGAASPPLGGSYRVDIRPESASDYTLYSRSIVPVTGGVLATINSDLFDDGLHTIRVTLYDATGTPAESCAIPVIFR